MSLINCETNLNCVITDSTGAGQFKIPDTKLSVPAVTLSTQDNTKLLKKLKSGFKRKVNWNKYLSKVLTRERNQYLDYLIDPNFSGANRLFDLQFEDNVVRTGYKEYLLPKVETIDDSVKIDRQNFFDQSVKNDIRIYENIRNIATG